MHRFRKVHRGIFSSARHAHAFFHKTPEEEKAEADAKLAAEEKMAEIANATFSKMLNGWAKKELPKMLKEETTAAATAAVDAALTSDKFKGTLADAFKAAGGGGGGGKADDDAGKHADIPPAVQKQLDDQKKIIEKNALDLKAEQDLRVKAEQEKAEQARTTRKATRDAAIEKTFMDSGLSATRARAARRELEEGKLLEIDEEENVVLIKGKNRHKQDEDLQLADGVKWFLGTDTGKEFAPATGARGSGGGGGNGERAKQQPGKYSHADFVREIGDAHSGTEEK